jgi:hypothetical protein
VPLRERVRCCAHGTLHNGISARSYNALEGFEAHPANKRKLGEIRRQIAQWERMIEDNHTADSIYAHALGVRWD